MLDLPPPPPRPPEISISYPDGPVRPLLREVAVFTPGPVVCAGKQLIGGTLRQPFSTTLSRVSQQQGVALPDHQLSFAIDANGRPRTIRRIPASAPGGVYLDSSDLAPALAASRFAPGAPREECRIAYRVTAAPPEKLPPTELYAFISQPPPRDVPRAVFDLALPDGSTCVGGPGPYLRTNQPDFDTIPQAPGDWSWTLMAYDVRSDGRTEKVRVLGSSGNPALDRAAVAAVAANRFRPGATRLGCVQYSYRSGKPLAWTSNSPGSDASGRALPGPEPDAAAPSGCRLDPSSMAPLFGTAAFPREYRRRGIKGRVNLSYDAAPWGEIGNVRVISSEPGEAFGEAARAQLLRAKLAPSTEGVTGCRFQVRFRLPAQGN